MRHLTFSNIVSVVALLVSLGGVSWAATTLPRDSVGARQIRSGAVTSDEVRDRSLRRQDFAAGTLLAGPQGPAGDQGPKGDRGERGEPGEPGTARAYAFVDALACDADTALCPTTKSKNIIGARRIGLGEYCIQAGSGIEPATTIAAAGADSFRSDEPEGNGVVASNSVAGLPGDVCHSSEFHVETFRIPTGTTTGAVRANNVGFWVLVP